MSVENVVEKLSALLDFQVIGPIKSSFVNSAAKISFFGFSLPTADEHVQREHIINCEFLRIHPLLEGFLVDDDLVAINQVFFKLVREDSLQRVHFVGVTHFLDDFSDLVVDVAWLDQSESSLGGFVCSQNDISLLAGHLCVFVRLHNDGVAHERGESVNVDS